MSNDNKTENTSTNKVDNAKKSSSGKEKKQKKTPMPFVYAIESNEKTGYIDLYTNLTMESEAPPTTSKPIRGVEGFPYGSFV